MEDIYSCLTFLFDLLEPLVTVLVELVLEDVGHSTQPILDKKHGT